ncbi:bifunctional phosphopantothenoylcysteine decarboxylase/phosphopantothenate--cysteine ligase CoaBC [Alkalihalobacillus macyae]|uniref:bifunctional phosphopantothenoylcysteine decarboxylase/phosphopantothenate--cysteine ligase CoaBC n=1 Tax=Guptibacillus hwajinpoensis TaxID=208199 RepID=UPI00273AE759|nr:bifunctional phosphopantothenoylcysteine decarboxylase/phosphopantothenate--cysteine ligase CoaBC [Alkalihalobacillus macyae]MDP4551177.1 bifunctional phosphopantothenoylcysteine decarboxylase/phosphopantothenate--cysteine ligase CoaBC [Alkalihalobacillus macyae]
MSLRGKKILLCVSGGIAVFKAAALTSKLYQTGAEVKVLMTNSATEFVTPLTFQTLSRNEVYLDTFEEKEPSSVAHIDVADWADLVLIAPATANMIGKLANGIADDMMSTTLLATEAPVWVAPAMNVHMYDHPAVKKNMDTLRSFGCHFLEPGEGLLACGYVGKGRMAEPEDILSTLETYFSSDRNDLNGKQIVITAGPTREAVDPVRYFTNYSSGKMGFALAEQAAKRGADVTLIAGPVSLPTPEHVKRINVVTADDMFQAVIKAADLADVVIKAAAVADYRPALVATEKMKKSDDAMAIEMERTKDILWTLGQMKTNQILVGFAAESERLDEYAKKKLEKKNLDLICANNIKAEGAGFDKDTNVMTLMRRDGERVELPLQSKHEAANRILDEVKRLDVNHT